MQIYFPNNQTWRLPKRINGIIPYDRQDIMHLWHGKIVLVLQRKRKDICPARQYNRLVHHQITMSFQKPWIQIMYRRGNVGTTFLNSVALNSHVFLCVPSRVCIVGCFCFFFFIKAFKHSMQNRKDIIYSMRFCHCFSKNGWKRHKGRALSVALVNFSPVLPQFKAGLRKQNFPRCVLSIGSVYRAVLVDLHRDV